MNEKTTFIGNKANVIALTSDWTQIKTTWSTTGSGEVFISKEKKKKTSGEGYRYLQSTERCTFCKNTHSANFFFSSGVLVFRTCVKVRGEMENQQGRIQVGHSQRHTPRPNGIQTNNQIRHFVPTFTSPIKNPTKEIKMISIVPNVGNLKGGDRCTIYLRIPNWMYEPKNSERLNIEGAMINIGFRPASILFNVALRTASIGNYLPPNSREKKESNFFIQVLTPAGVDHGKKVSIFFSFGRYSCEMLKCFTFLREKPAVIKPIPTVVDISNINQERSNNFGHSMYTDYNSEEEERSFEEEFLNSPNTPPISGSEDDFETCWD